MTQAHVDLVTGAYLKALRKNNKRKINVEALEKLKRRLFDEQPKDEVVVKYLNEPTIYFHAYKSELDNNYYCETCFLLWIDCGKRHLHIGSDSEILHNHLCTGELSEKTFNSRGYSRDDPLNICHMCKDKLTIVRPYDSALLDFS